MFHLGDDASELDMQGADLQTQALSSTLGTGGGTLTTHCAKAKAGGNGGSGKWELGLVSHLSGDLECLRGGWRQTFD
jgi:hypothetical protein